MGKEGGEGDWWSTLRLESRGNKNVIISSKRIEGVGLFARE